MVLEQLTFDLGTLDAQKQDHLDVLQAGVRAGMSYFYAQQGGLPLTSRSSLIHFYFKDGDQFYDIRLRREFMISERGLRRFLDVTDEIAINAAHIPLLKPGANTFTQAQQTRLSFNLNSGAMTLAQSEPIITAPFLTGLTDSISSAVGLGRLRPPLALAA